jgi:hypothetical protein
VFKHLPVSSDRAQDEQKILAVGMIVFHLQKDKNTRVTAFILAPFLTA